MSGMAEGKESTKPWLHFELTNIESAQVAVISHLQRSSSTIAFGAEPSWSGSASNVESRSCILTDGFAIIAATGMDSQGCTMD